MSKDMPQSGYIEDCNSPGYDVLSRRYADLWRGITPDAEHYENMRKAYMEWCLALRDAGLKPDQGSAVLLGPGYGVAQNRELEPGWVHVHVAAHPRLVVADFSREALVDAFHSLKVASRRIRPENIRLMRRDFSGGLSTRLESMIGSRLDAITDVHQFKDFMLWLEKDVGVEEVSRQAIQCGPTREGHLDVIGTDRDQLLCFRNILQGTADVRFVMANGVFSGVFFTTEDAFREKLMHFAEANPEQVTRDDVLLYMHIWHSLITDLIDEVTVNALQSLAQSHPDAHVFCTVDRTAQYDGLDDYPRMNLDAIRGRLVQHYSIRVAQTWTLDDSTQTPPHKHAVCALEINPINYEDEDEDEDDDEQHDPISDPDEHVA